jgi:hypothetical protein
MKSINPASSVMGTASIGKTTQTPAHLPDKTRIKFNMMTGQKEGAAERNAPGVSPHLAQGNSLDRSKVFLLKSNF